jgi:hypothetical protein
VGREVLLMYCPDLLADETPLTNTERLDRFYARLAAWHLDRLAEKVEELDELVGMGEVPTYLRRQAG